MKNQFACILFFHYTAKRITEFCFLFFKVNKKKIQIPLSFFPYLVSVLKALFRKLFQFKQHQAMNDINGKGRDIQCSYSFEYIARCIENEKETDQPVG